MRDVIKKLKQTISGNKEDDDLAKIQADKTYEDAYNELAMYRDMRNRFKDYETDVSVGNMYQRKKKVKKPKTKRKSKKKGCGCK